MPTITINTKADSPSLTPHGEEIVDEMHESLSEMSRDERGDLDYDEFASEFGVEYVGSGSMRAVFTTNDEDIVEGKERSVIKVEKDTLISGNMREIANWYLISEIDPSFATSRLAELYDYDEDYSRWLVMEMAPDYPGYKRTKEAESIFENSGWVVVDYGTSNTGLIDGNVVLIDYGLKIEGVENNPKLDDTIYDGIPRSIRKFDQEDTTMQREVDQLIQRIRENNVTKQDIQEAAGENNG